MEEPVAQQSETDALSNLPFVPSSEARPYDFGVLVGDTFYLWDARLDVASRALRRLKDRLNTFITIVAALVTGVLFALFLASTFVLLPIEVWSSPDFLIEPSSSQLLFWLSVAGGLYLIYRRALARKEPREIVVAQGVDIASRQTTWETVHGNRSINTVHISSRCASDAWRGMDDAARVAEKVLRCSSTARIASPNSSTTVLACGDDLHAVSSRPIAGNRKSPPPNEGSKRRFS